MDGCGNVSKLDENEEVNYAKTLPLGFVDLAEAIPGLIIDARYAGNDNFLGRPVNGYNANKVFISEEAAIALKMVQEDIRPKGLQLKIFDGYRPQRAVDDFITWVRDPLDTKTKSMYYPHIPKNELIPGGYIAPKSGHSRGSTVDLTLAVLSSSTSNESGVELDMGSPFDYFGRISHPDCPVCDSINAASSTGKSESCFHESISKTITSSNLLPIPHSAVASGVVLGSSGAAPCISLQASQNRKLLQNAMIARGFLPIDTEWWHFTLKDEPYPDTYFDFIIK
mmetsp:Transcript_15908/g.26760  ORF Transcript_15908/g.26760 Transcript_15908/m.26760 type:complete len:282 (+) Transcript_15908:80-925(+)